MTEEKLIELAKLYGEAVRMADTLPKRADPSANGAKLFSSEINRHLGWMCSRIIVHAKSNPVKMQRWLGFVQGVLWREGQFTVDQLRAHNAEEMSIP